jgi:23S rRNA (adenine1618-N6)-methyltransferase
LNTTKNTKGFHTKNKHNGKYDFKALIKSNPDLTPFVSLTEFGTESIDFSDPEAVKMLNKALLLHFYGLKNWDIPKGFLCPPIPGRAEYIHQVADVIEEMYGTIQTKHKINILDIGVGANCIYPIIGVSEYDWRFVGSDIDKEALGAAKTNVNWNQKLRENVEIRLQSSKRAIFKNIIRAGERFDVTICNPPFHSSREEALQGAVRKNKNLGTDTTEKPVLNFGGVNTELWCEGGELAFISNMIYESVHFKHQVKWFSTLVSKKDNLKPLFVHLKKVKATYKIVEMQHGNKVSRILFWTFKEEKLDL